MIIQYCMKMYFYRLVCLLWKIEQENCFSIWSNCNLCKLDSKVWRVIIFLKEWVRILFEIFFLCIFELFFPHWYSLYHKFTKQSKIRLKSNLKTSNLWKGLNYSFTISLQPFIYGRKFWLIYLNWENII